MKLASFRAPGGDPQYGEVRDGRVVAFDDGSTVKRPPRLGRPHPGLRRRRRPRRRRAARAARAARDLRHRPQLPRPRAGAGRRAAREADRLHEAADLGRRRRARPVALPAGRPAPGLRGRARRRDGRRRRGRGLRGRRRRQRARPAGASPVDAREGRRRLLPFGPWITTADEVARARGPRLRTWVNGELRQDSRTSDLHLRHRRVVAFISRDLHARAGRPDPHRHAERRRHVRGPAQFLASGDVVRIEIEGLGVIEHAVA